MMFHPYFILIGCHVARRLLRKREFWSIESSPSKLCQIRASSVYLYNPKSHITILQWALKSLWCMKPSVLWPHDSRIEKLPWKNLLAGKLMEDRPAIDGPSSSQNVQITLPSFLNYHFCIICQGDNRAAALLRLATTWTCRRPHKQDSQKNRKYMTFNDKHLLRLYYKWAMIHKGAPRGHQSRTSICMRQHQPGERERESELKQLFLYPFYRE